MVEIELFLHRGSPPRIVSVEVACLRFAAGNEWRDARWEFTNGGDVIGIQAEAVEELSSRNARFDVKVVDGSGKDIGKFEIQSVLCSYPNHCFCFLFSTGDDGLWSGYTINRSFGQIVAVPYRFDPT